MITRSFVGGTARCPPVSRINHVTQAPWIGRADFPARQPPIGQLFGLSAPPRRNRAAKSRPERTKCLFKNATSGAPRQMVQEPTDSQDAVEASTLSTRGEIGANTMSYRDPALARRSHSIINSVASIETKIPWPQLVHFFSTCALNLRGL